MASTLAAPKFSHFIGQSYNIALNQSIELLLSSLRNPISQNSANFASEFQEFVQIKDDPPLESIWIYTALTYTRPSSSTTEPLTRLSDIKDLFQLIVSCSVSCNSTKCIALLAPVIYNLHKFILDLKGFQLGSKKERKVSGEIKSLADSIIGYISVCCNGADTKIDDSEDFIRPLSDLISIWLVDNGVQNMDVNSLGEFFPLLSNDIAERVSVEGFEMIDLAGFVIAEAFLLKLCLKIRDGFGEKVQNELRTWIVGSVTGLRSSYFYVTLLSMLLEPALPITSLVNLELEDGLRKVLLDSLLLVEYSFIAPKILNKLPAKHAKRIILTKLMASFEAIELYKEHEDQTKHVAYLNAFANSSLPSLIIKWIRNELGNELSTSEPTGSSPRAFLKWMLNMENRGIKIFDDDMSKFRSSFNTKEASNQLENIEGWKKSEFDLSFFIDNKGQEEFRSEKDEKMSERMNAAFMAAAHSIQSPGQHERKQKTKDSEKIKKVKFVKYNGLDLSSLSDDRSAIPRNDRSNSGSDVENPSSSDDDDMEMKE